MTGTGNINTHKTQALLGGKTRADMIIKRVLRTDGHTNGVLCFISTREGVSPKNAEGRWDKSIVKIVFLERMMLKLS